MLGRIEELGIDTLFPQKRTSESETSCEGEGWVCGNALLLDLS